MTPSAASTVSISETKPNADASEVTARAASTTGSAEGNQIVLLYSPISFRQCAPSNEIVIAAS